MDATGNGIDPAPDDASGERTLLEVVRDGAAYARAWSHLVSSEAALARAHLVYIAVGALLLPALAFGIVAAADAVLAALLFELLHNWLLAVGAVALLNVAAVFILLWLLRNWWRTLSLPLSRRALNRLWSNDGEVVRPEHEGAPAGGAV